MNHHIFLYHIQCIALHNLYLYLMRTECALFCHPCASVSRPVQQKIGSHLRPRGSVFPRPFPRADGVTTSTVRLLFTPLRGLEVKLGVTVKKKNRPKLHLVQLFVPHNRRIWRRRRLPSPCRAGRRRELRK